uniref:peptidylamidoglycolate lyase n=1 Tax=Plectus sambesii TaxID=2011161 RepID=A0A914XQF4_9BILA
MRVSVVILLVVLHEIAAVPVDVPVYQDDSVEEVPQEPLATEFVVDGAHLGQVTGLGVDSEQRLHVFHRCSRVWDQTSFDDQEKFNPAKGAINASTIIVVDPETGKVLEKRGADRFYMPHGLTVDHEDNVWVTDVALHQVMKFRKGEDKPSLTLGEAFVPGNDDAHFCKPTDVAVASNGDFFVADGYCNSRIMKFDKNGNLLTKFGGKNAGFPAGAGQLNVPHSITLIEDLDLVCVADRENERIQCFSAGIAVGTHAIPTGMLITKAENLGRVYAIREKAHYLVGVTGSDLLGLSAPQVFVMDVNTGKAQTYAKGIESPHDLAITDSGTVFIGEIGPNRILKLQLAEGQ